MKKRILVLLVALLCLVSFASCKKDTPESLYNGAMTAMEEAEGFEAKAVIKMNMKMGSMSENTTVEMDIKANGNDMAVNMKDSNIVYIDGMMYMDMGELGKYKTEVPVEEFLDEYGMTMNSSDFPKLSEEDFADIELKEDGDVRSFTLVLDADDIKEIVDQTLSSMVEEGTDVDYSDISLTLSFDKDDNLIEYSLKMKMTYTEELLNAEIDIDVEMIYEFINPGKVPTITAPSDAADYIAQDLG